jgi:hypothetical protein
VLLKSPQLDQAMQQHLLNNFENIDVNGNLFVDASEVTVFLK